MDSQPLRNLSQLIFDPPNSHKTRLILQWNVKDV